MRHSSGVRNIHVSRRGDRVRTYWTRRLTRMSDVLDNWPRADNFAWAAAAVVRR